MMSSGFIKDGVSSHGDPKILVIASIEGGHWIDISGNC